MKTKKLTEKKEVEEVIDEKSSTTQKRTRKTTRARTNETTFQLNYRVAIEVKQEFDKLCDSRLHKSGRVLEFLMKKYIEEEKRKDIF